MCIRDRFYTCSANTEIFDLLGQMLPDTNSSACSLPEEYPSLMDIQMDPPSAFYKLTGQYQEGITAVSYTHLDVYKRQLYIRSNLLICPTIRQKNFYSTHSCTSLFKFIALHPYLFNISIFLTSRLLNIDF